MLDFVRIAIAASASSVVGTEHVDTLRRRYIRGSASRCDRASPLFLIGLVISHDELLARQSLVACGWTLRRRRRLRTVRVGRADGRSGIRPRRLRRPSGAGLRYRDRRGGSQQEAACEASLVVLSTCCAMGASESQRASRASLVCGARPLVFNASGSHQVFARLVRPSSRPPSCCGSRACEPDQGIRSGCESRRSLP
jgi:hypothetical protein